MPRKCVTHTEALCQTKVDTAAETEKTMIQPGNRTLQGWKHWVSRRDKTDTAVNETAERILIVL